MKSYNVPREEIGEAILAGGIGFCRECGSEHTGIEPDAEGYLCEECGEHSVYGAEIFAINGWLEEPAPAAYEAEHVTFNPEDYWGSREYKVFALVLHWTRRTATGRVSTRSKTHTTYVRAKTEEGARSTVMALFRPRPNGVSCRLATPIDLGASHISGKPCRVIGAIGDLFDDSVREDNEEYRVRPASDVEFRKYTMYTDSGHGWLAVPIEEIDLALAEQISGYSYIEDGIAYLEEDVDATRFALSKVGNPELNRSSITRMVGDWFRENTNTAYQGNFSPIRDCESWSFNIWYHQKSLSVRTGHKAQSLIKAHSIGEESPSYTAGYSIGWALAEAHHGSRFVESEVQYGVIVARNSLMRLCVSSDQIEGGNLEILRGWDSFRNNVGENTPHSYSEESTRARISRFGYSVLRIMDRGEWNANAWEDIAALAFRGLAHGDENGDFCRGPGRVHERGREYSAEQFYSAVDKITNDYLKYELIETALIITEVLEDTGENGFGKWEGWEGPLYENHFLRKKQDTEGSYGVRRLVWTTLTPLISWLYRKHTAIWDKWALEDSQRNMCFDFGFVPHVMALIVEANATDQEIIERAFLESIGQ